MEFLKTEQPAFVYDQQTGVYNRVSVDALNEAVLVFTGQLRCGEEEITQKSLSYMDGLFVQSDFVCAPIAGTGSADGLQQAFAAGYTMLYTSKSAGPDAAQFAPDHFLLDKQNPEYIVRINHIQVAFVDRRRLSKEHADQLRKNGADFIIALTDRFVGQVKGKALDLAEAGADLIVMTAEGLRKNINVETKDGRKVPYIGGLGYLTSAEGNAESAAIRIRLIRSASGKVSLETSYVPVQQRKQFKGIANAVVPAHKAFNRGFIDKSMKDARKRIAEQVGRGIKKDSSLSTIRNKSGFKPQICIREVCGLLGIDAAAYEGAFPADEKVHSIVIRKTELDQDCVAIIVNNDRGFKKSITPAEAIEAGAVLAITDEKVEGIPCLVVDDPAEAYIQLTTHIREQYHPLTVAVTGTIGKSTTTDMIKIVMRYGYKTLDVRGNYNTYKGIGLCVQKLDDSFGAYVQEVHGGQTDAASINSKIVQPDMAVVTFIGSAHLSQVRGGTVYDVLREKLRIVDGLREGGTLFINNDNEYLREAAPAVNTIRYAANNKDADYYAEDIIDYGDHITFTIVCDEGRYEALLNCSGTYNVANAVCAFAVGRKANIPPERILAGLSRYRTEGYRQNVVKRDGCIMRFDCDSTTPDSMISALKSFAETRSRNPGRFIAILGDTAMLGTERERWHREYGQLLGELKYDAVLTLGPGSRMTAEEAAKAGIETHAYMDREEFEEAVAGFINPGDNIIFKSSPKGGFDLIPSVERLFGKIR